ncbi:DUF1778 domain-containing protein [Leifsonia aquatica]|uniref:type II toxin-antitoxin system TacA family antitoxin n=1 Tax=Leifsonia aquatica TaxID=144185 RepID=UPI00046A8148|nr:DUF1778 domain-containing protein [Leifsonia aquatica]
MTATERLEFRVSRDHLDRIALAAQLSGEKVGAFAREAAEERADRVLRAHEATTTVPIGFFDDLWEALDEPANPNTALAAAGDRLRGIGLG